MGRTSPTQASVLRLGAALRVTQSRVSSLLPARTGPRQQPTIGTSGLAKAGPDIDEPVSSLAQSEACLALTAREKDAGRRAHQVDQWRASSAWMWPLGRLVPCRPSDRLKV